MTRGVQGIRVAEATALVNVLCECDRDGHLGWDLRWTPAIENPSKAGLFRIIGDVWSEPVDRTTEVTVRAEDDVRRCHERLQWE